MVLLLGEMLHLVIVSIYVYNIIYKVSSSKYLYILVTDSAVCGALDAIANGMISYSTDMTAPYSVGTVATYTCNSGYELSTTGDEMRTCMDNGDGSGGTFGGTAPTCKRKFL